MRDELIPLSTGQVASEIIVEPLAERIVHRGNSLGDDRWSNNSRIALRASERFAFTAPRLIASTSAISAEDSSSQALKYSTSRCRGGRAFRASSVWRSSSLLAATRSGEACPPSSLPARGPARAIGE